MTSVRSGDSVGRSDIASRWPWPLARAISSSACSSITGERRRSGPATRDLVLARELPDQRARRIGEQRQPLGKFGARGGFGMRDEVDQESVEQIDMVGPQVRGALKEQLGDPACGLGAALGIAIPDDLIEPGDQRRGDCHRTAQLARPRETARGSTGNLSAAW